jgi:quercetin 2,3-dioxygenase
MTAGSGLEHSELSSAEFLENGGPLEILQLWVNLPSRLKMTTPRYEGRQRDEIPTRTLDGATMQLISGDGGAIDSLTGIVMTTVAMNGGSRITLDSPGGRNVFFYIVRGSLNVGRAMELVEFNDDGDTIELEANSDALVLFGHADPLGEPVVSYGPFVMNTREEIVQAINDYQRGLFR